MESRAKTMRPIIIRKSGQNKIQLTNQTLFKSDLIYESKDGDFLHKASQKTTIINTLNRATNVSRTIVTYSDENGVKTGNSDAIVQLIGQDKYDILFSALCSVISQELKVRGILALLTTPKKTEKTANVSTQTDLPLLIENSSQTKESHINMFAKPKIKRIRRRTITPYVVKESKVNKVVINPEDYVKKATNEFSSNESWLSIKTTSSLLYDPLSIVEKPKVDVSSVTVKSENLSVSDEEKNKMEFYQSYLDWTKCLEEDEDGNLPIHTAVLDNDIKCLWRQCQVLQRKKQSVDIPGNSDWTALKLAILKDHLQCTEILLKFHPNLLLADENNKICLHHAAEIQSKHLNLILDYCKINARKIISEDEDLWKENFTEYSDEDLLHYLMNFMCNHCDNEGNTPLNIASKRGNYENVRLLLQVEPSTVNFRMPTNGDTALHSAVVSAITEIRETSNKTTVENYKKTIEQLIINDACPSINNTSGVSVNDILTESNVPALSLSIANAMASKRLTGTAKFDSYMLLKNKNGDINVTEIKKNKNKTVILENVLVTDVRSLTNKVKSDCLSVCKGVNVKNIKITAKRKSDEQVKIIKKVKV